MSVGVQPLPPSAPQRLPNVPRLSIRYLLLWTATTAVTLAIIKKGFGETDPLSLGLLALAAILIGWMYAGALLILWHAVRKTLWPLEPGEWLILMTVNALTVLGGGALAGFWEAGEWLFWGAPAEMATVFIVPAILLRNRRIWSALFCTLAVSCLSVYLVWLEDIWFPVRMNTFFLTMCALIFGFSTLSLALLMAGAIHDRRHSHPRHWLHWSGVVLVGLALVFTICWSIVFVWML